MARARYDVGLHGEVKGAPVEVGVAVDGDHAVGVSVEAPTVGHLVLSLALLDDGAARLVALERDGAPVAIDQTQSLRLEAELARARLDHANTLAVMETARDEARDRAAALKDELGLAARQLQDEAAAFEHQRQQLEQQLSAATGATALEKDQRLAALQDRERLRAELAELTTRHQAGATEAAAQAQETIEQLQRAAEASQRALDQARTEWATTEGELNRRVERLEAELAQANRLAEQTASALAEARERAESSQRQATELTERVAAADTLAAEATRRAEQAEAAVAASREAEGSQLALARTRQEAAEAEREALQQQLAAAASATAEAEGRASAAGSERDELQQRVSDLHKELSDATATASQVAELRPERDALAQRVEVMEGELAAANAAAQEAAANAQSLQTERDGLQQRTEALEAEVATQSSALAELSAQAAAGAAQSANDADQKVAAITAERDEARAVARQVQTTSARLLAERDEARSVARSLHTRLAAESDAAKKELAKAQLQIDSLGRQLEAERGTRARLTAERDALRESVVKTTPPTQKLPKAADPSRLTTTPYELQNLRSTQPEMPAVGGKPAATDPTSQWGDEATALTTPGGQQGDATVPIAKVPKKP